MYIELAYEFAYVATSSCMNLEHIVDGIIIGLTKVHAEVIRSDK